MSEYTQSTASNKTHIGMMYLVRVGMFFVVVGFSRRGCVHFVLLFFSLPAQKSGTYANKRDPTHPI